MRGVRFWAAATAALFLHTAVARGQDGGVPHAQVNTKEGVACLAIFDGGQGLCFPAPTVPYVVETLRNRPACDSDRTALESCNKRATGLTTMLGLVELEAGVRKEQAEKLQKGLDAAQSGAASLQSALSSTKWKWFWSVVGTALGVGAAGFFVGRALK